MSVSNISFRNHVSSTTNPPTIGFIDCSNDIVALICRYLNSTNTVQVALTNHKFCFLVSNGKAPASLWGLFLRKDFFNSYTAPPSENENFALYKSLKIAVHNMKIGKYRFQTLNGHQARITCMMSLDGKLISGSDNGTIKIWDPRTRQELLTLSGHQNWITCMTILDGNLISGSGDTTIKIWDSRTGQELLTLSGHQARITCMTILDGKLISGSADKTIKIWDPRTGQELLTLSEHQARITCMTILDGKLISGLGNGTIKIWNPHTGQLLKTLSGHRDWIRCMTTLDGNLISGSTDCTIKIWDPHTGQLLKTLSEQGQIECMTTLDGKLIFGSLNSIKILDLSTGQELQTFEHQGFVMCVTILDGKLISRSTDGTIKIWDLSTGQLLQTLGGRQGGITSPTMIRDGKLISGSWDDTIKILDFNDPPYSLEVLEENLALLEKMLWAPYLQKSIEELTEKLHSDFKERLRQHAFKLKGSYAGIENAVLRVRIEVCLEALLNAIHEEDHKKVSSLLDCLTWNRKNIEIYDLLGKICSESKSWAEQAFHNQQGCSASPLQKEQAVVELKQMLKDLWNGGQSID